MSVTVVEYGPGGFDPAKPDSNVVSTRSVPQDAATVNADTIRAQAAAAMQTNRDYIASTPTAATTTAQVKALSRQNTKIIRLLLNQLDGTD